MASFILITQLTLHCLAQVYVPYRSGQLWGICDTNKKIIVTPNYTKVSYLNNHITYFYNQDNWDLNKDDAFLELADTTKHGLFYNGKIIIPVLYDKVSLTAANLLEARQGINATYYNLKGQSLLGDSMLKAVPHEWRTPRISLEIGKNQELMVFVTSNGYYLKAFDYKKQTFSKNILNSKSSMSLQHFDFKTEEVETKKQVNNKVDPRLTAILKPNTTKKAPKYTKKLLCKVSNSSYSADYYIIDIDKSNKITATPVTAAQKNEISAQDNSGFGAKGNSGDGYLSNRRSQDRGQVSSNGPGPRMTDRNGQELTQSYHLINDELWLLITKRKGLSYSNDIGKDTISLEKVSCESCTHFAIVDCQDESRTIRKADNNNMITRYTLQNYAFYRKNNKWGVLDMKAGQLAIFDTIIPKYGFFYSHEYVTSMKNEIGQMRFGVMHLLTGKTLDEIYDSIPLKDGPMTVLYDKGGMYIYNDEMKINYGPVDSIVPIFNKGGGFNNTYYAYKGITKQWIYHNGRKQKYTQSPWLAHKYIIEEPIERPHLILFPIYNDKYEFLGYSNPSGKLFFED
jgi:hypothetical protein